MSYFQLEKKSFSSSHIPFDTKYNKMVSVEKEVNGVIVPSYDFKEIDFANDGRKDVRYQDLCLGNLRALGQLDSLKQVMLQRDDVDEVSQVLESAMNQNAQQNESSQVSS